jgi:hypothetical protein
VVDLAIISKYASTSQDWASEPQQLSAVITAVAAAQLATGVKGNVGEIGGIRSDSFAPIAAVRRQDENAVEIDDFPVFAKSGEKNDEPFKLAIRQYLGIYLPNIVTFFADPATVEDHVLAEHGRFRILHIAAGQGYSRVRRALSASMAGLGPGGVLIVSDFDSPAHPGVRRACAEFQKEFNHVKMVGALGRKAIYARERDANILYRELLAGKPVKP